MASSTSRRALQRVRHLLLPRLFDNYEATCPVGIHPMKPSLPTPSEELAQAAIKGVVSAIPVVGGLIAELGMALASPLEKRKQAWCRELENALQVLTERF